MANIAIALWKRIQSARQKVRDSQCSLLRCEVVSGFDFAIRTNTTGMGGLVGFFSSMHAP